MHKQKNNNLVIILIILIAVAGCVAISRQISNRYAADQANNIQPSKQITVSKSGSFKFTALGDISSSKNASHVLTKLGKTKNDFTLALGDLGYDGNGTEEKWCDFVKERIGSKHPFQLVAGNHDDGNGDGDILAYRKCLPNKIKKITGNYGLEYYFDHKKLARFILISPDIDDYGFSYNAGSKHYNWLSKTIDSAREKNIPWIIVGMHKNCITIGEKTCEIEGDLLDLLVKKKIDIVLQGHEHGYMRSKQLALTPDCPSIMINSTNSKCIKKSGNTFKKGDGTIIAISGAGGKNLRGINLNDPEKEYFQTWNGSNIGNSYGFSMFNISKNRLISEFVPATNSYTDSFSITKKN